MKNRVPEWDQIIKASYFAKKYGTVKKYNIKRIQDYGQFEF